MQFRFVAWVDWAKVRLAIFVDEPPSAGTGRQVRKYELNDCAGRWQRFRVHSATNVPHEHAHIEFGTTERRAIPALRPCAELRHDRPNFPACSRQLIVRTAAPNTPLQDSAGFKLFQSHAEQRTRHPWHATV